MKLNQTGASENRAGLGKKKRAENAISSGREVQAFRESAPMIGAEPPAAAAVQRVDLSLL
ncbi:MAG: hypothetical protein CFK52_08750 [Chloracidobacterium sp. CP2_5A]|nr:MAG: hypothetical protein CFK52_08750 [Chloracidobacterium sp. CP2_5A]